MKAAAKAFLDASNNCVITEISAAEEPAQGVNGQNLQATRSGSIVSTTTIETHVEPSPPRGGPFSPMAAELEGLDDLAKVPLERGLLLLAEMSSEANLMTADYTRQCVSWARQHRDFVIGFIGQRSLNEEKEDNFLTLTPGVSLPPVGDERSGRQTLGGDGLGQQYNTPRRVVYERGCDAIIVGRGILGAQDRATEAERYRREAWKAYLDRLEQ